jgi:hypothetical protein
VPTVSSPPQHMVPHFNRSAFASSSNASWIESMEGPPMQSYPPPGYRCLHRLHRLSSLQDAALSSLPPYPHYNPGSCALLATPSATQSAIEHQKNNDRRPPAQFSRQPSTLQRNRRFAPHSGAPASFSRPALALWARLVAVVNSPPSGPKEG